MLTYEKQIEDKDGKRHVFCSFCQLIEHDAVHWKKYLENLDAFQGSDGSYFEDMPSDFSNLLETFEKLLVIKIFRP